MRLFRLQHSNMRTASEWFALIRSGELDARVEEEWTQWVHADPQHLREYEDRELLWEVAVDLSESPTIRALLKDTNR